MKDQELELISFLIEYRKAIIEVDNSYISKINDLMNNWNVNNDLYIGYIKTLNELNDDIACKQKEINLLTGFQ